MRCEPRAGTTTEEARACEAARKMVTANERRHTGGESDEPLYCFDWLCACRAARVSMI